MALEGSLSITVSIGSSPDRFYELWKAQVYHLPAISPNHVQNVAVHEGEWHGDGAVKIWNYTVDGKAYTMKDKVSFDDANKSITLTAVEGDLLEEFRSFKAILKVDPKESWSTVTWTILYEKMSEIVVTPFTHLAAFETVTKDVAYHLLRG